MEPVLRRAATLVDASLHDALIDAALDAWTLIESQRRLSALLDSARSAGNFIDSARSAESFTDSARSAEISRKENLSQWHRQCEKHCCERNDGQARWPNASSTDIPATEYMKSYNPWTVGMKLSSTHEGALQSSHRGIDELGHVVQD